jgi:hypothetical protein
MLHTVRTCWPSCDIERLKYAKEHIMVDIGDRSSKAISVRNLNASGGNSWAQSGNTCLRRSALQGRANRSVDRSWFTPIAWSNDKHVAEWYYWQVRRSCPSLTYITMEDLELEDKQSFHQGHTINHYQNDIKCYTAATLDSIHLEYSSGGTLV